MGGIPANSLVLRHFVPLAGEREVYMRVYMEMNFVFVIGLGDVMAFRAKMFRRDGKASVLGGSGVSLERGNR